MSTVEESLDADRLQELDNIVCELVDAILDNGGDTNASRATIGDDGDLQEPGEDELKTKAIQFANAYHMDTPGSLSKVSSLLSLSARRLHEFYLGSTDDRETIILRIASACYRAALDMSGCTDDKMVYLYKIQSIFNELFDRTSSRKDIDAYVSVSRELLSLSESVKDQELQIYALDRLALALSHRCGFWYSRRDMNEALQICGNALAMDPNSSFSVSLLITQCQLHETGMTVTATSNTNIAVTTAQKAVDSAPENSSDRAEALCHLSMSYIALYDRSHDPADLDKAIENARASVILKDHIPDDVLAACWTAISSSLDRRYERTGERDDINEALKISQMVLDMPSQRILIRVGYLNDFAARYCTRYQWEEELSDLDEAISLAREASSLSPKGSSSRVISLCIHFSAVSTKIERSLDEKSLEEAGKCVQELTATFSESDPLRGLASIARSWLLLYQYDSRRESLSMDDIIKISEQAVELAPCGSPLYADAVGNLASRLMSQYQSLKKKTILDTAIRALQKAVSSTPDSPSKAARYLTLAAALETRSNVTGDLVDSVEALTIFREGSQSPHYPPLRRITSARSAIKLLIDRNELGKAMELAKKAMDLIPLACRRFASRIDKQNTMMQISGFAAEVASLSLRASQLEEALQQLEFGRGLILAYSIDERDEFSDLRKTNYELSRRYEILRYEASADEIESYRGNSQGSSGEMQSQIFSELKEVIAKELGERRRKALREIEGCIEEIRKMPGYVQFQMPLEINEIKQLAADGPIVVVNISRYSADAVILTTEVAKSVHLPKVSMENAPHSIRQKFLEYTPTWSVIGDIYRDVDAIDEPQSGSTPDLYEWLWNTCVDPVFKELIIPEAHDSPPIRVWWIGTGIASSLPFHAAGVDFGPSSIENTLGRVVPSYTPTFKALAHSRSRASISTSRVKSGDSKDTILLVTMPTTCGRMPLPAAEKESKAIQKAIAGVYSISELRHPTAQEVIKKLSMSNIVHFACHASSDPRNPYHSHLLLQKVVDNNTIVDELSMAAISEVAGEGRLWIAFLSACSTAEVKASQLADEGLHLASAFQLAGFAHAIGSLWAASDTACAIVAEEFYTKLAVSRHVELTSRTIAEALRHAVIRLRAESLIEPSQWAGFVHFGA